MTDPHAPHGDSHPSNYQAIFGALIVCTILSWLADEALGWGLISSRKVLTVVVLAVAVAKAQFVMRYFMHLRFEGRWKYVLLLPTVILACGLPLALAPDIGLHYYTPLVPQVQHPEHAPEPQPQTHADGEHPQH